MEGYKFQSRTARTFIAKGRREGLQEGREEDRQSAVLELARAKLGPISAEETAMIRAMRDGDLFALIVSLGKARDARQARAAIARAAVDGREEAAAATGSAPARRAARRAGGA